MAEVEQCGRIRVVIVDDAQPLRRLLRTTLARDGRFEVVGEADNGRDGVEIVLSCDPDIVLLDLAMPVMDGLEAIPRIVAGAPRTRIVVLSGFEARQVEDEIIELGAAAYLPKGIRPAELTETLSRICGGPPASNGTQQAPVAEPEARPSPPPSPEMCLHLVDMMRDYAICTLDAGGTVTSWNRGAQRVIGYPGEEIVGAHISRFYEPAEVADGVPETLLARAAMTGSVAVEGWRIRQDGTRYRADVVLMALRDDAGTLTGFLELTRDTTELRNSVDALERTNHELRTGAEQLLRTNRELDQLASVLSHDLNEPLRVVSGFATFLADDCGDRLDHQGRLYLRQILEGIARMRSLIDDLISYARVGGEPVPSEPVECVTVMRAAVETLSLTIGRTGAEVITGELPTVPGPEGDLFQLFQNLVGNALKFVAPGVAPRVEVMAHAEDTGWHFTVSDNGIGIEPRDRQRTFRMFQRLHPRDAYEGTGIGLAICEKVVQRRGGRIWIEGRASGGTEVHFTISG